MVRLHSRPVCSWRQCLRHAGSEQARFRCQPCTRPCQQQGRPVAGRPAGQGLGPRTPCQQGGSEAMPAASCLTACLSVEMLGAVVIYVRAQAISVAAQTAGVALIALMPYSSSEPLPSTWCQHCMSKYRSEGSCTAAGANRQEQSSSRWVLWRGSSACSQAC